VERWEKEEGLRTASGQISVAYGARVFYGKSGRNWALGLQLFSRLTDEMRNSGLALHFFFSFVYQYL
jgi:hypothetical protein